MALFRNVSGGSLDVYRPGGHPGSLRVPAGETLEVSGVVQERGDAYQVGDGKHARLYPKALWEYQRPQDGRAAGKPRKAGQPSEAASDEEGS